MSTVLVVAPHPDDETLGCGGTLLRMKENGHSIHWLIVTSILEKEGYSQPAVSNRQAEIEAVANMYGFCTVHQLDIPTTKVDRVPFGDLVSQIANVLDTVRPSILFLPYCNDAHTDHFYIAKAALSCCKWFRHPYIENILYYETVSETDFNINPAERKILLNVFVDVTAYFETKLSILQIYKGELGIFPFPRSLDNIQNLAALRGSQCGSKRAEAFELVRGTIL